jgi:PmbA protein
MVGHEGADYADAEAVSAISSTTGVRASESETSTYIGTYALASDGTDTTTGFGMSVGRGAGDLDVAEAVDEACERALSMLGASKAPSHRTTVVFDPYVTSQFLSVIAEMLSGDMVERGRSPFAGRIGEVIASELLTLGDDPLNTDAPTASGIDGEGLACRPLTLVEGGMLTGFMHNSYTARCMATQSTGSAQRGGHQSPPGVGPKVFGAKPGTMDHEALLGFVGDGVLVHEVAGMHSGVNPVSGDLSVGIEGRVVRNGNLAEPIREVTIASTLQRMLTEVVAVGNDLRYFPWEASGVSLAIADVTVSGS